MPGLDLHAAHFRGKAGGESGVVPDRRARGVRVSFAPLWSLGQWQHRTGEVGGGRVGGGVAVGVQQLHLGGGPPASLRQSAYTRRFERKCTGEIL